MKKLLIVLVSLGLALGASAQKIVRGGYHHIRSPRVIVGVGAGYYPFYSPYGFYSPFGYPYGPYGPYGYRSYSRPSKLELQVQDIRLDYADRISSVRSDPSMKGRQRRHIIKQLKNDRDRAIVDAKRNYYYNRSSASQAPVNNDSNNSNNNNDNYNQ